MLYVYDGIKITIYPDGRIEQIETSGQIEAMSRDDAASKLLSMRIMPTKISTDAQSMQIESRLHHYRRLQSQLGGAAPIMPRARSRKKRWPLLVVFLIVLAAVIWLLL